MKASQRIACIDYGMKRLGLAWSDSSKMIAFPLEVILAEKQLAGTAKKVADRLLQLAQQNSCTIDALLIGNPLHMDGKVGVLADEAHLFQRAIASLVPFPVQLWAERLSTAQAEKALYQTGLARKKRSSLVDQVSACLILQSFLDAKHFSSHAP